jgi:hypothetical protein
MCHSSPPASPRWSDDKSPYPESSTDQSDGGRDSPCITAAWLELETGLSRQSSTEQNDATLCSLGADPGAVSAVGDAAVSGGTLQHSMATESQDTVLIDDRIMEQMSYMDREVQKWAFHQLRRHELGLPGVAVFDRSLSYTDNVKRKPSTSQDLQDNAYIVDQKPWAIKPQSPGENEPSTFNPPGTKGNIQLIGYVNGVYDETAPGDQDWRLAYNFAGWKKNKATKRKAPADDDANPDKIKVCGFYRVNGELLKKIERLSQKKKKKRKEEEFCCTSEEEAEPKNRRALAKLPENDLTASDLGAVLYIVLPSSYEPMTRRRFEENFPRDNLSGRTQEFQGEGEKDCTYI